MDLIDLMKDEKGPVTLEGGTTKIPTAQFEDLIRQSQTLQITKKMYAGLKYYDFNLFVDTLFGKEMADLIKVAKAQTSVNKENKGDNDA